MRALIQILRRKIAASAKWKKCFFSELIGNELELTQCRLNGGGDCRFETGP